MINSLEVITNNKVIKIDLNKKEFTTYFNDEKEIKKIILDTKQFNDFFIKHTLLWSSELTGDTIDGPSVKITAETESEEIVYNFQNKVPDNYSEFYKTLIEMVKQYE